MVEVVADKSAAGAAIGDTKTARAMTEGEAKVVLD